jgi:hypothetical protein
MPEKNGMYSGLRYTCYVLNVCVILYCKAPVHTHPHTLPFICSALLIWITKQKSTSRLPWYRILQHESISRFFVPTFVLVLIITQSVLISGAFCMLHVSTQ